MARMLRKQIYINQEQDTQLKRLSRQSGESEAELIRQAIDNQVKTISLKRDFLAWQDEAKYIKKLINQAEVVGGRSWTREELHER